MGEAQECVGEERQYKEDGYHAGAIDGEAAKPLDKVVAVGPEDKKFVTEVRHCDANGQRSYISDIRSERQIAVRK